MRHGPVRQRTPLDSGWQLRLASPHPDAPAGLPGRSIPARVPGAVHIDLLAAGLIPDPYLGTNELAVRWIGRCDWTYALRIELPEPGIDTVPDGARRHDLVFDGLDTLATVVLDGRHLGDAASTHRTWRWDVTDLLTPGLHLLEVRFRAPLPAAEGRVAELGRYPHSNADPEPFNMIRTMACSFGWDWGPQLPGAGIWRPAWIDSSSVARLREVRPSVGIDGTTGTVDLRLDIDRIADPGHPLHVVAAIGDATVEASIPSGCTGAALRLDVADAGRWWPHSHGDQPRVPLRVELWDGDILLDVWHRPVGFRTVALDIGRDAIGSRFQLIVNDVPIWVRGANWIPDDAFPARLDRERYRERIVAARDANVDLLRVWGGGTFESDDFYDLCDELGMLVWQDFPFACATYPETPEMTRHVVAEAHDNITRLMSHPSLALWNGNNECVWLADVEGWAAEMGDRPWGRTWWEATLPAIVADLDPGRPYWPGSPTSPAGSGAAPNDPHHGTMHIWDVWNERDYDAYREHRPRFAAEFGFQGPATWSTLSRALGPGQLAPDSPMLAHRQKATDGMGKLERGLLAHFAVPDGMDDWLYLTQLNQARAITLGVEHLRSIGDVCSGSIVWQLNDCWPVISWSAIDGDGRRKPMWYALRRAYADRLLTIQPEGPLLRAVLVNESGEPWHTEIHARRLRLDGERQAEVGMPAMIGPRGIGVIELPGCLSTPQRAADEILVLDAGEQRSVWTWQPDRQLHYPTARWEAMVERHGDDLILCVTAGTLLRDLCLFPDRLHADAVVDEMLVTLLPGESATFRVSGADLPDPMALTRGPVLRCVNDRSR